MATTASSASRLQYYVQRRVIPGSREVVGVGEYCFYKSFASLLHRDIDLACYAPNKTCFEVMFDSTVLPHLNSAYNLARWLTRNEHDAEDIVQEAFLRALRSFHSFIPGRDGRAWLLTVVRNSCRTWLKRNRSKTEQPNETSQTAVGTWSDSEADLIKNANSQRAREALEDLPVEYREILVLRELEELLYKEIGQIIEIPLGTVIETVSSAKGTVQPAERNNG
jgi:RNA polymerase sigma factor (sigma-70 family)